MLTKTQLKTMARSRLAEARILHRAKRFDGAKYLCGYAVEIALKRKICETLSWKGFPETDKEFAGITALCKIHKLDHLLRLTGQEQKLRKTAILRAMWSTVTGWDSENRYRPIGSEDGKTSQSMIKATQVILRFLGI